MLPITLALGLFQVSVLMNSLLGTLVSEEAPAAIDRAFRIVVLPQAVFSIAITTTLFPTLARLAAEHATDALRAATAHGLRMMSLLMLPSAALMVVLAEPLTRLIYERGAFDARATSLVSGALAVWALSLPLQAASSFLSQTFFSLQRAWITTALSACYVVINVAVGLVLYKPFGVEGVVFGTVAANVVLTIANTVILSRTLGGLEGRANTRALWRMLVGAVATAAVTAPTWMAADRLLGRGTLTEALTITVAATAGAVAYAVAVFVLRVPEAREIWDLLRRPAA
jgi:putative peptidoglycan lipid II flippase